MADVQGTSYTPDVVYPPGETLREVLEDRGIPQAELARLTGRPKKTINEIIQGVAQLTPETALQLERVLGVPARFWLNLEHLYREHEARRAEEERLKGDLDWLKQFPVAEMVRRGWLPSSTSRLDTLRALLGFFGVASPKQFQETRGEMLAAFRKSTKVKPKAGAVAVWLRYGELSASRGHCATYDEPGFQARLGVFRALTTEPPTVFQPQMERLCAEVGAAVVFVKEFPGAGVNGATYWVRNGKRPVIQLSLRYKTNDQLWFTFFHEAGHILKHRKQLFLEYQTSESDSEAEADRFAADQLIAPRDFSDLRHAGVFSRTLVQQFAKKVGIAPGIVVGRLQHEGLLPMSHLNDLKISLEWAG